jgi:orotidine-5'-phosphate decarboxylase
MTRSNPICVALDTPDVGRAAELASALKPHIGYAKIGMEFFYAHGAAGYAKVAETGLPIFLDLKLHDIPNTVEQGLRSLMRLVPAPAIVNVHATGGLAMMQAARMAVPSTTKLIAVTILTSLSEKEVWYMGYDAVALDRIVTNLAKLAAQAGLDGVVCSPSDLYRLRRSLPRPFLTVVPGIRPAGAGTHDQKRVATPQSATAAGADILVIGRAITGAADPAAAARSIMQELGHG